MSDASPKQINANQHNAQASTGPKTAQGKAISKYNALKHGLLSKEVLLDDENETDLISLGKTLRAELAPANEFELILVDRITANVWRLRRAMLIEREMMTQDREPGLFENKERRKLLGEALSHDFNQNDTYGKFIRYEASIERGIYKALHELQRLQAKRNDENTPPPLAVDVDISGEGNGFVS